MVLADYIYQKPVTETERLRIRPMSAADVPALTEWMPDPSIYTYWGKGPSKGEKNPQLLFEKEAKPTKSLHLGIALKDADQVIGDIWVYLIENDRMASVAVRLSSNYQGKGYGTEALSAMTKFCFENIFIWRRVNRLSSIFRANLARGAGTRFTNRRQHCGPCVRMIKYR